MESNVAVGEVDSEVWRVMWPFMKWTVKYGG
jgi:hypothetical protein